MKKTRQMRYITFIGYNNNNKKRKWKKKKKKPIRDSQNPLKPFALKIYIKINKKKLIMILEKKTQV